MEQQMQQMVRTSSSFHKLILDKDLRKSYLEMCITLRINIIFQNTQIPKTITQIVTDLTRR